MKSIEKTLELLLESQEKLHIEIQDVKTELHEEITQLDGKIESAKIDLHKEIQCARDEARFYYAILNKKLDDNLEEIGEMLNNIFPSIPSLV